MACQEDEARTEAMLGELAELSLVAARELVVRLRESEDAQETAMLADAFHKAGRAMRLTLALKAKLARDAAREAREDRAAEAQKAEAEAVRARQAATMAMIRPAQAHDPVAARKRRVAGLLNRLLWNECEGDAEDHEVLTDDLSARLDEAARSDSFMALPVEVVAGRIAADMALSGELTLSLREMPAPQAPAPEQAAAPADTS